MLSAAQVIVRGRAVQSREHTSQTRGVWERVTSDPLVCKMYAITNSCSQSVAECRRACRTRLFATWAQVKSVHLVGNRDSTISAAAEGVISALYRPRLPPIRWPGVEDYFARFAETTELLSYPTIRCNELLSCDDRSVTRTLLVVLSDDLWFVATNLWLLGDIETTLIEVILNISHSRRLLKRGDSNIVSLGKHQTF